SNVTNDAQLALSGGTLTGALTTVGISNCNTKSIGSQNIELSNTAQFKQAVGAGANKLYVSDSAGVGSWTTGTPSLAGLSNVTNDAQLGLSGGTLTGALTTVGIS